ncbi:MAG: hypothetical protein VXZ53_13290 [Planctomycetota bacterium]|nr:hypothetical protein [Pirellulaceae bacterium]MEC8240709.1 hypothetical protein [Planctomycetota bacterium]MEC8507949.1 hypothetical protein [Planctomycetota bacterium]
MANHEHRALVQMGTPGDYWTGQGDFHAAIMDLPLQRSFRSFSKIPLGV